MLSCMQYYLAAIRQLLQVVCGRRMFVITSCARRRTKALDHLLNLYVHSGARLNGTINERAQPKADQEILNRERKISYDIQIGENFSKFTFTQDKSQ